jgi:hypothetical protein
VSLAVKGNVFAIHQGVTYKLNMGDYIEDFVEILTEENGQISFSDFHDHTYHVSGSGHIKVMNKITEIRSGSLWVQSDNRMEDFLSKVQTQILFIEMVSLSLIMILIKESLSF